MSHVPSETGPLLPELVSHAEGAELMFGPLAPGQDASPEFQAWQVAIPSPPLPLPVLRPLCRGTECECSLLLIWGRELRKSSQQPFAPL